MKIIILGGQGNLGSQLAKALEFDHQVFSYDKSDFNALDKEALFSIISEIRPDAVFNCIAYNAVDKCEDKDEYANALALNRDLPAQLADYGLKLKFILIHFSTDYVFSGSELKKDFYEHEIPNPINKYGESKFMGEREIERRLKGGLDYYIVRTSKLFGPKGISPQAKSSFFDIMLSLGHDKKELSVVNEELSCFTYTPDLALASSRLLTSKAPFGIYHLVNEGAVTWYEGAVELFKLAKMNVLVKPVRSENLARPARRPKFSILQNTKAKKLRHYTEALQDYLNYLRD